MAQSMNRTNQFYAVQFIELPFEGIDDYVCVPDNWVTLHRSNGKALVAYPLDIDHFTTRDRVKNREAPGRKWRSYFANIKYASDNFDKTDFWIATRNDYGPIQEVYPNINIEAPNNGISAMQSTQPQYSRGNQSLNDPHRPASSKLSGEQPTPRIAKVQPNNIAIKRISSCQSSSPASKQPRRPEREISMDWN